MRSLSPLSWVLWGGLGACQPAPAFEAERAYHGTMAGLLADNAALARQFQDLAVKVKKDRPAADVVAARFADDFIPAARTLADAAAAVTPGTRALTELHPQLVDAWSERVTLYESAHSAWKAQDLAALDRAAEATVLNRRAEEAWLRDVNIVLAGAELALEAYPPAPAIAP
jgi:hypothetical protein